MDRRAWRIGALAWVAGEVDTYGYLSLGHVFVSHMTGNAGVLTIALVQHRFGEAFHRGIAVPLFFAGALLGAALVESADDARQVARAFIVEALLLAGVTAFAATGGSSASGWRQLMMLLLLSGSMGLQNAALTHPGTRGTHSTHLTGPLTDLATDVVRWVVPRRRDACDRSRVAGRIARVVGFALGGVCGAILFAAAPVAAPMLGAMVLAVVATRSPGG